MTLSRSSYWGLQVPEEGGKKGFLITGMSKSVARRGSVCINQVTYSMGVRRTFQQIYHHLGLDFPSASALNQFGIAIHDRYQIVRSVRLFQQTEVTPQVETESANNLPTRSFVGPESHLKDCSERVNQRAKIFC